MSVAVAALRCHATNAESLRGAEAFAQALGERLGEDARLIGDAPESAEPTGFRDDLERGRECFRRAGDHVGGALAAGDLPVITAADCSLCMATLAAALQHQPDARVLWLDAHGDFNVPETTPSGFLGGMCLAAACGQWDAGVAGEIPTAGLVLAGVRDLDPEERRMLEGSAAILLSPREGLTEAVIEALGDAPVYVHLDVDVLAPEFAPARYPAPGGLTPEDLEQLLAAVAEDREIVGAEVTAFDAIDPQTVLPAVHSLISRGAHVPG